MPERMPEGSEISQSQQALVRIIPPEKLPAKYLDIFVNIHSELLGHAIASSLGVDTDEQGVEQASRFPGVARTISNLPQEPGAASDRLRSTFGADEYGPLGTALTKMRARLDKDLVDRQGYITDEAERNRARRELSGFADFRTLSELYLELTALGRVLDAASILGDYTTADCLRYYQQAKATLQNQEQSDRVMWKGRAAPKELTTTTGDAQPLNDVATNTVLGLARTTYGLADRTGRAADRFVGSLRTSPRKRFTGAVAILGLLTGNVSPVNPQELVAALSGGGEPIAAPAEDHVVVAHSGVGLDALMQPASEEIDTRPKAAILAEKVLEHPNISIAKAENDRVRESVIDMTNDGATFRFDIDHKHEEQVDINPLLLEAILILADAGHPVIITSFTTSHDHSPDGFHPKGWAVDIDFKDPKVMKTVFETLYQEKDRLGIVELIHGGELPEGTHNLKQGEPYQYDYEDVLKLHAGYIHFAIPSAELPAAPETAPGQEVTEAERLGIPQDYYDLYRAAAQSRGIDWTVLAAIGQVETRHGQAEAKGVKEGQNFHGCCAGPMQFFNNEVMARLPKYKMNESVWARYGVDGNGDGIINVYDPADAIPAAADKLLASGIRENVHGAIFGYNRSNSYVRQVLAWSSYYAGTGPRPN